MAAPSSAISSLDEPEPGRNIPAQIESRSLHTEETVRPKASTRQPARVLSPHFGCPCFKSRTREKIEGGLRDNTITKSRPTTSNISLDHSNVREVPRPASTAHCLEIFKLRMAGQTRASSQIPHRSSGS